jgi:putative endonuclease
MEYFYVYFLMNRNRTALYVGVTNNLERRIIEHYQGAQVHGNTSSFTAKYKCYYCIAYEYNNDPLCAIQREDEIKGWRREKKLQLAETLNPGLNFLNDQILGVGWEETYRIKKEYGCH